MTDGSDEPDLARADTVISGSGADSGVPTQVTTLGVQPLQVTAEDLAPAKALLAGLPE